MSIAIFWNKKLLLNCQNYVFRGLHDSILATISENELNFNEELSSLIGRLEIARDGWGFDLAKYITSKKNLLLLSNLLRNAIDRLYQKQINISLDCKEIYENFYQELINIQQFI